MTKSKNRNKQATGDRAMENIHFWPRQVRLTKWKMLEDKPNDN